MIVKLPLPALLAAAPCPSATVPFEVMTYALPAMLTVEPLPSITRIEPESTLSPLSLTL